MKTEPNIMENGFNVYSYIMRYGIPVAPRGHGTLEVVGETFVFKPTTWFLDYPSIPTNYSYVKTELRWYLKGEQDDLSIAEHASIWLDMIEDGVIESNYGYYYWQQLGYVCKLLKEDPDSRRAVININRPYHNTHGARDVPCTIYFNFMIRDGKLNMHAHMRSQDAVYGLRNDLPAFQMFKLIAATELGIEPGLLYLSVDSLHVYQKHFNKAAAAAMEEIHVDAPSFTSRDAFYTWLYTNG